jgi:ubiquinone/menaquinone biosynthesis C-methylase UbiE
VRHRRVAELLEATGARVVGIDLAPALIETARERAAARGLTIDFRVCDCENLSGIDDAAFDAVGPSVGIVFAPDHGASASELARVTKPGGRIALANWKPGPGVQDMFKIMAPFQPAPPPSTVRLRLRMTAPSCS